MSREHGMAYGWGTYRPDADGICRSCGRSYAWHAGRACFGPEARGMPSPLPVERQLELDAEWSRPAERRAS